MSKKISKQARPAGPSRSPERPVERRHYLPADERRQRILDSSRDVFARTGLQGARTRDLAKAAGINPATLFAHFASKEDLFAAAVLQPLTTQLEGIRERYQTYETAKSAHDLLNLLQTGMLRRLESMVEIFPLLMQALSDQALGQKLYVEQIVPMIEARTELTRGSIKEALDPELVELASFGMFFAIAMDRVMTGRSADLADVSRQLTELIVFGCTRNQWNEPPAKKRPAKKPPAKKPPARKSGQRIERETAKKRAR